MAVKRKNVALDLETYTHIKDMSMESGMSMREVIAAMVADGGKVTTSEVPASVASAQLVDLIGDESMQKLDRAMGALGRLRNRRHERFIQHFDNFYMGEAVGAVPVDVGLTKLRNSGYQINEDTYTSLLADAVAVFPRNMIMKGTTVVIGKERPALKLAWHVDLYKRCKVRSDDDVIKSVMMAVRL